MEKNRHAEWNETTTAIPAPASIPTTVRREVRATRPVANSTNRVDERANTGRNGSSTSSHEDGNLSAGSIGNGFDTIA